MWGYLQRKFLDQKHGNSGFVPFKTLEILLSITVKCRFYLRKRGLCPEWLIQVPWDSCLPAIESLTWRDMRHRPMAAWSPWVHPRLVCTLVWMIVGGILLGPRRGTRSALWAKCLCPPWHQTDCLGMVAQQMTMGTNGLCFWVTGMKSSASESSSGSLRQAKVLFLGEPASTQYG